MVSVLFLLVLFVLLSSLIYTPGSVITLPTATGLVGTDNPTVIVEVGANGQYFFENKLVSEGELRKSLQERLDEEITRHNRGQGLTLALRIDAAAKYETVTRLGNLARDIGIKHALQVQGEPVGAGHL